RVAQARGNPRKALQKHHGRHPCGWRPWVAKQSVDQTVLTANLGLHALVVGAVRLHDDVDATILLVLAVVFAFGFANGHDRDVGRERHAGFILGIHDSLGTTLG